MATLSSLATPDKSFGKNNWSKATQKPMEQQSMPGRARQGKIPLHNLTNQQKLM